MRTRAAEVVGPYRMAGEFPVFRRGDLWLPASLPPARGKVPSACEADEGGLRNGRTLSTGWPVSGPYEKEGPASKSPVGAAPCGRPPFFSAQLEPRRKQRRFQTEEYPTLDCSPVPVAAKDEGRRNPPIKINQFKPKRQKSSLRRAYYSGGEEHEQTQNQTVIPTNGGEPAPESPAAPVS